MQSSDTGTSAYKIKEKAEDFIVEEITKDYGVLSVNKKYRFQGGRGEYLLCVMKKRNWDTLLAVEKIAKQLNIPNRSVSFAGTKDKRSISSQLISIKGVRKEELKKFNVENIELVPLAYRDRGVFIGDLVGNHFIIRVYSDREPRRMDKFPNFFGEQRFGVIRPITADVGESIVKKDFEKAVMTYLTAVDEREDENSIKARKKLAEEMNFKEALKYFPKRLRFERKMLVSLSRQPRNYLRALRMLPRSLLKMFVHAYQAKLFNEFLAECIKRGLDYETGPIYGYALELENELEQEILERHGLTLEDFRVNNLHDLRSKGTRRKLWIEIGDMKIVKEAEGRYLLDFSLPKGSYATVVIDCLFNNCQQIGTGVELPR